MAYHWQSSSSYSRGRHIEARSKCLFLVFLIMDQDVFLVLAHVDLFETAPVKCDIDSKFNSRFVIV